MDDPIAVLRSHLARFDAPLRVETSFKALQPWARTWFCVSGGALWTTPKAHCKPGTSSNARRGCGTCMPKKYRKGNLLQFLLNFMMFRGPIRADLHACATFSCQDAPRFAASGPRRFVLSYSSSSCTPPSNEDCAPASERTWDVPFVDYHMPLRWPSMLAMREEPENRPPTWEQKRDMGLLAFGGDISQRMKSLGNTRFFTANATPAFFALRHAFYHSCGKQKLYDWADQLHIVGGPESTVKAIGQSAFCQYKYIVLLAGHSSWLDSIKYLLLCGSLIIYIADTGAHSMLPLSRRARDPIMHVLRNGSHWLHYQVDGGAMSNNRQLCDLVAGAIRFARERPEDARAIGARGAQLVDRYWSVRAIYDYVNATLEGLAALQGAEVVNATIQHLHGARIRSASDAMDDPEIK